MKPNKTTGGVRRSLTIGLAAALATIGLVGTTSTPAAADGAKIAVAMGDSSISGEGAGNYENVADLNGNLQGFPGWAAENKNSFFCHRSMNASIKVANLPQIDANHRFNLACSGGQPADITAPSIRRPKGRLVKSQLDQLRELAAQTQPNGERKYDIDVVLIGLAANNSQLSYGDIAKYCVGNFYADAYVDGKTRYLLQKYMDLNKERRLVQAPCRTADIPERTISEWRAQIQAETLNSIRAIVQTLKEIDPNGQKIILQDYANPLPPDFHPSFLHQSGETDQSSTFRPLSNKRYIAGCPVHRDSLATAAEVTAELGNIVSENREQIKREFPTLDIRYMNVQSAFDGARLCEQPNSPVGALVTPLRFQKQPNGNVAQNNNSWKLIRLDLLRFKATSDVKDARETCEKWYQTCQESFHPSAAGHAVLGQCLSLTLASNFGRTKCLRNPSNGELTLQSYPESLTLDLFGDTIRLDPRGPRVATVNARYSLTAINSGSPISDIHVNATVEPQLGYQLPEQTTPGGTFSFEYPCDQGNPVVIVRATAKFAGATVQLPEARYVAAMGAACE